MHSWTSGLKCLLTSCKTKMMQKFKATLTLRARSHCFRAWQTISAKSWVCLSTLVLSAVRASSSKTRDECSTRAPVIDSMIKLAKLNVRFQACSKQSSQLMIYVWALVCSKESSSSHRPQSWTIVASGCFKKSSQVLQLFSNSLNQFKVRKKWRPRLKQVQFE